MKNFIHILANYIAMMSPHNKERKGGMLLVEAHKHLVEADKEIEKLKEENEAIRKKFKA